MPSGVHTAHDSTPPSRGARVPGFIVSAAIALIRSSVLKKAGLDILALRPIADVDRSFVPVLFCAGSEDGFIKPHHSEQIYAAYASEDKQLRIVPGDHNSARPASFHDIAGIFLRTRMGIPDALTLDVPLRVIAHLPLHSSDLDEEGGTLDVTGLPYDRDLALAIAASLSSPTRSVGIAPSGTPPAFVSPMPKIGPLSSGRGAAAVISARLGSPTHTSSGGADTQDVEDSAIFHQLAFQEEPSDDSWNPAAASAAAALAQDAIDASAVVPDGVVRAGEEARIAGDPDEEAMLQEAIAASLLCYSEAKETRAPIAAPAAGARVTEATKSNAVAAASATSSRAASSFSEA